MTKMAKIYYLLNEEGRKKSLLSGGDGKEVQVIETEINEKILKYADVDTDGNVKLVVGCRLYSNSTSISDVKIDYEIENPFDKDTTINRLNYNEPYIKSITDKIRYDKLMTVDELLLDHEARLSKLNGKKILCENELESMLQLFNDAYKIYLEAIEKEKAEAKKKRLEKEAEEKANKELLENEKVQWVTEFGSEYLKKCIHQGYNCQRQYVTERAKYEFEDYVVDFDDNAAWNDRSCPSEEAINEEISLEKMGYNAQVVWLTKYISSNDDDYDYFEEREAVVIRGYLGKYDLIKLMGN